MPGISIIAGLGQHQDVGGKFSSFTYSLLKCMHIVSEQNFKTFENKILKQVHFSPLLLSEGNSSGGFL